MIASPLCYSFLYPTTNGTKKQEKRKKQDLFCSFFPRTPFATKKGVVSLFFGDFVAGTRAYCMICIKIDGKILLFCTLRREKENIEIIL